jgi:hypothetical protein
VRGNFFFGKLADSAAQVLLLVAELKVQTNPPLTVRDPAFFAARGKEQLDIA